MSIPRGFALIHLTVCVLSVVGCSSHRTLTEPGAVPPISEGSVLHRERESLVLKAAHDEIAVPIRMGLPVVVLFPKPILAALRSSCAPLSVGRNAHALSIKLEKPLADTAPLLWVELEDHTLFALRLAQPKSSRPARARIEIPDTRAQKTTPHRSEGCCE